MESQECQIDGSNNNKNHHHSHRHHHHHHHNHRHHHHRPRVRFTIKLIFFLQLNIRYRPKVSYVRHASPKKPNLITSKCRLFPLKRNTWSCIAATRNLTCRSKCCVSRNKSHLICCVTGSFKLRSSGLRQYTQSSTVKLTHTGCQQQYQLLPLGALAARMYVDFAPKSPAPSRKC